MTALRRLWVPSRFVRLQAAAQAQAGAAANLATGVTVSGSAVDAATAAAQVTTKIQLRGNAQDAATASAQLTGDVTWSSNVPDLAFTQGTPASYSLIQHTAGFDPLKHQFQLLSGTLPSGVTLNASSGYVYSGSGTGTATGVVIAIVDIVTGSTFQTEIAKPAVVWWHGFNSAAEVNQFRWTGNDGTGAPVTDADPNAQGSGGAFLQHVATGGPGGGGFLRSTYPLGSVNGRGNSVWWRPFTPLTGATNGKGTDDPGANGTIAPQAWSVTPGSTLINRWGQTNNAGWYGAPAEAALVPSQFQGNDFFLQVRVRRAQSPGAPPDAPPDHSGKTSITGKFVWLTASIASFVPQEIVTAGQSVFNADTVGQLSRHNMYDGQNFNPITQQPNQTTTIDNFVPSGWRYSGGWDTLLYHMTPGTNNGTGANRSRLEVWAQHDPLLFPAESGVYTKIWDTLFTQGYEQSANSLGTQGRNGYNALICGSYHNGSAFLTTSFNFDYAQMIFSKATIAAPV